MSEEQTQKEKTCRICFEKDFEYYVSPCLCKGSQKWVHTNCLRQWLKAVQQRHPRRLQSAEGNKKELECQLCLGKIFFEEEKETKCLSCTQFKHKICQNLLCSVLFSFLFLGWMGIFIYLIIDIAQYGWGYAIFGIFLASPFICLALLLIYMGRKKISRVTINEKSTDHKFQIDQKVPSAENMLKTPRL